MLMDHKRCHSTESFAIWRWTICTGFGQLCYETVHNFGSSLSFSACCLSSTAASGECNPAAVDAYPDEAYSRWSAPFPTQSPVAGAVRL
jgi:hypothetical protein